ncbi:MAG: primosomal protein N' [Clostridium sp.]|nr:primosomal protein N' [Clostridium sp.]MCM1398220.1 primosomal protein N' [Clostridium sp.]MCM1460366.1 primosomal protein N' [Bacteroides sp.]
MSQKYADIIIDISHEAIDRAFQYRIPKELEPGISVGVLVTVPFGKGDKIRTGYVTGISEEPEFDVKRMKDIQGIAGGSLPIEGKLIKLAAWMREKYGSTMINCLMTVMPVKEQVRKHTPRIAEEEYQVSTPVVTRLNLSQQSLADDFSNDIDMEKKETYLLHGVTGSGKTEVYIECIKKVVSKGKQAVVLVPEIALTYQNVARFKQHFKDRVAVINSKQSKGEKYREFMRAQAHEVDVVIGPRSALFSPCANLGLIVIDEEHDSAYKSDMTPKYHARDVAIKRAEIEGASVILGSATPSVESYMAAKLGRYKLWKLDKRANEKQLASVSIVDLRQELRMGNRGILSDALKSAIDERLKKKEQIMLFINRRGYNSFISCRECGEAVKCPKCDVSLSYHKDGGSPAGNTSGMMVCHYCGYSTKKPDMCPSCSSKLIGGFGTGTEKVEAEIKRIFPDAKTLRMDKDTTKKKTSQKNILETFHNREADILIGTQMIVKGHDFGNVTLVGIIIADTSLFANDYRAGERTFDLLTQAAGRAGRGSEAGQVIIQTYQPDHYAITAAAKQDYEAFFDLEMAYRRMLSYPPICNMMVILMVGGDYDRTGSEADRLGAMLKEKAESRKTVRVIGPSDATIGKINSMFRKVIYVKSNEPEEIFKLREIAEGYESDAVSIMVDINPMNMY